MFAELTRVRVKAERHLGVVFAVRKIELNTTHGITLRVDLSRPIGKFVPHWLSRVSSHSKSFGFDSFPPVNAILCIYNGLRYTIFQQNSPGCRRRLAVICAANAILTAFHFLSYTSHEGALAEPDRIVGRHLSAA